VEEVGEERERGKDGKREVDKFKGIHFSTQPPAAAKKDQEEPRRH